MANTIGYHSWMTRHEKRIKIAEACGFVDIVFRGVFEPKEEDYVGVNPRFNPEGQTGIWSGPIPNYFKDLNAVHEAERIVLISPFSGPENETAAGSERLSLRLERFEDSLHSQFFGLGSPWHATAAQRAEALGLALGLWSNKDTSLNPQ